MIIKRVTDIIGAILGLLLFAPFLPLIALAVKLEDGGPVFVKLYRVSQGRIIQVYKLRTMIVGAEKVKHQYMHLNERDGGFFKIKNDPRITKTGRWLRRFRLDEFPQLVNVLKNELSLVGPRPHEPGEVAYYPKKYRYIPFAKAGVSGLSQISGASNLPFMKELELDDYYLRHRSWWLDAKIIAKTLLILFFDPTAV